MSSCARAALLACTVPFLTACPPDHSDPGSGRPGVHAMPPAADAMPRTREPILHYTFNGDAINTGALDGYDGIESNVSYVNGRVGKAVHFAQAGDSLITLPGTRAALSGGEDYTISLWFREDAVADPGGRVSYLLDFRGDTGGFHTYHGVTDALTTCYSADSGGGYCDSFNYEIGVWHHLLYRHDRDSTVPVAAPIGIYLDGEYVTALLNGTGDVIFSPGQAHDMTLGVRTNFYLDDLRIYNQVFSEADQCINIVGGIWTGSSCTVP